MIADTHSPLPNPLPQEREQDLIPLILREKGLGDEGVQNAWLLNNSLSDLIHDPKQFGLALQNNILQCP